MLTVNIATAKGLIEQVAMAKRRAVMLHGPSGIGKSELVAQIAVEHDATLVDIRVSQYESIDFRGIPNIVAASTVWNMPSTLPFKGNPKFDEDSGKLILLFLDEVNQGDPSVMSVCYQLLNDYRIGEHELMNNVRIIAAGNRAQDRGVTNKFPAPLANRITHCELAPDVKSWTKWATARGTVPATLIGFLNFRNELLHTFDPAKPTIAFATPRTWSFVAADMEDQTLTDDVRLASMAGSVGEGPAVELGGFIEIMSNLVPIADIIADPTGVKFDRRLDMQWAMATHVGSHMDKSNADRLHKFLARMEPEMTVMGWMLAIGKNDDVTDSNAFLYEYAPQYRSMFS